MTSSVQVLENGSLVKEIAGSPEIKGVRGTDKKKYLIDLMRIHPRDANYKDIDKETTCVVREELIRKFILNEKLKKDLKTEEEKTPSVEDDIK